MKLYILLDLKLKPGEKTNVLNNDKFCPFARNETKRSKSENSVPYAHHEWI